MKSYLDLDFDKGVEVLKLECDISIMEAFAEYKKLMQISEVGFLLTEKKEVALAQENVFITTVNKIITAIQTMLSNFFDMLKGITVKQQENLTPEDYKNSALAQAQIAKEVKRINNEIDDEILKRRKIIQLISTGTNIPDKQIAEFCDTKKAEAKAAAHNAKMIAICATPAVIAIGGKVVGNIIAKEVYKSTEKDHAAAEKLLIKEAEAKNLKKREQSDFLKLCKSIQDLYKLKIDTRKKDLVAKNAKKKGGSNK